jgi:hypothetical protein
MAPGAQNQQQPTKYFSGNGVSVAAMCADRHQYRPVATNEGGAPPAFDLPPEMTPRGDYVETWSP